ncbi:glycosyltransferase [candidate division KSB1 bacterium]|nr:glycosyltransferase [candidate division KSB1 bacterium]
MNQQKGQTMAKIDLHVHSKYSEHPSEWFLQRIGARESYTEPEYIYKVSKERGMDFVTLTDHNNIDGALFLKEKHPDDVIIGVESTTYFPEDDCKIHLLCYDINESQFLEIQRLRPNMYELREYIRDEAIAHSVAHATFSVNGKLTIRHLEKLILLFDVFEGINGGRNFLFNHNWMEILHKLTPEHISMLRDKYDIEPMSSDPWVKSFTGGSDDHAGLFVGNTYTLAPAETVTDIVDCIKRKKTSADGKHNNYKMLAFMVYKVAYDFIKYSKKSASNSLLFSLSDSIFKPDSISLKEKLKMRWFKSKNRKNGHRIDTLLAEVVEEIKEINPLHSEKRLEIVFEKVAEIFDELLVKFFEGFKDSLSKGDMLGMIFNLSSSIPGLFLSLPFITSLKHMYQNRKLIQELKDGLSIKLPKEENRIIWFTDTINDLNGVAETLKELGWLAFEKKLPLKIASAFLPDEKSAALPPNMIFLPIFYTAELPNYETYTLKFPSILKSIERLWQEQPTEIFISTPGPIGLIGVLMAKLLNIKFTGIYHTDFSLEIDQIVGDSTLTNLVENYTRWFYSMMDVIRVPTKEYLSLLSERGFEPSRMELFNKGIDLQLFSHKEKAQSEFASKFNCEDGINLLYTGRISKDKSLDFLLDVYEHLKQKRDDINLFLVGDGPYLETLKKKVNGANRVFFTGKLPRRHLPGIYSASDIFVFPSMTDTFGMVVMEAQACELPVVVSNKGGPKDVLLDGITGFVAKENNLVDWVRKIETLIDLKQNDEPAFIRMRKSAREHVSKEYTWEKVLQALNHPDG